MNGIRAAASQAGNHPVVEKGARLGYAASGLLHLLIAWVTLQLAWGLPGGSGGEADQEGALRTLAGNGVGSVLLWLTVVGFAFLALLQLTEAVARGGAGDRLKAAGKAVVYGALAWTAFTVVNGAGAGGSAGQGLTARLMATTGGRALVAVLGCAVIGVGLYHVVKGWTRRFLRDLREHPGRWVDRAGRVGYVAKGVALLLVGGFFVVAAATASSDQAQGLDGVLRTVAALPLGAALITLAALGFAAYGVYSFARARYGRV
jgi:hypothetical protein